MAGFTVIPVPQVRDQRRNKEAVHKTKLKPHPLCIFHRTNDQNHKPFTKRTYVQVAKDLKNAHLYGN